MGRRQILSCEKLTRGGGGGCVQKGTDYLFLSIPKQVGLARTVSVMLYPAVAFPNLQVEEHPLGQQKEQQAATGATTWLWAAEQKPSSLQTSNLKQSYRYVAKEIHYNENPSKYYQNYEWSTDFCHSTMM